MTYDDAVRFVCTWQQSVSVAEFCKTTGFDRRYASNTAASFRRYGVALKPMPTAYRHHQRRLTQDEITELRNLVRRLNEVEAADKMRRRCAAVMA